MFRLDTRSIAGGEEPFEPLVPKPFDRHLSHRNLMRYRLQGILKCCRQALGHSHLQPGGSLDAQNFAGGDARRSHRRQIGARGPRWVVRPKVSVGGRAGWAMVMPAATRKRSAFMTLAILAQTQTLLFPYNTLTSFFGTTRRLF